MRPYDCLVLFPRILLIAGLAAVLLALTAGAVGASEPVSEAMVLDSDGRVVSLVEDRSEATAAFADAVEAFPSRRLQLEYVYQATGTVPNPPNDGMFKDQWSFHKIGVPTSWASTDGADIVVAILDSAINFTGADGFCTLVVSPYDAIDKTEGLAPLNTSAEFGHGTHIAGTIVQCTNNGTGVAGIAPGATLMPIRVLSNDGSGTSSALADGIGWAVDHGADIINMSLGADCDDTWPTCGDAQVDQAIARASAAGLMLVSSSGNSALSHVSYPSAHPNVVSVGAVNSFDSVWTAGTDAGSNQGIALDLVAPGTGIIQETTNFGAYDYLAATGTSAATAHVSAAAALVLSVDPTLSASAVLTILTDTAVDLGGPGFDTATGWGRIAVDAAVAAALPPEPSEDPCTSDPCDTVSRVDGGGQWGVWDRLHQSSPVSTFYFGNPGDLPFMGDWDGSGEATPGLYRQSDGFVYIRNTNTQGTADLDFFFGNPGDVPLVGDFNGDGGDSVSIWRPSEARVFIINDLGRDGDGLGAAEFDFYFGNPGDTPFVGDFNGDGIDTIGLYRESTGFAYFTNTLATGNADFAFFYGDPGDQILAGDWDGDGDDTVGVYRPSNGKVFINLENTSGPADWEGYVGLYPWVLAAGRD
jgi:subtilisin family serine protease